MTTRTKTRNLTKKTPYTKKGSNSSNGISANNGSGCSCCCGVTTPFDFVETRFFKKKCYNLLMIGAIGGTVLGFIIMSLF